MQFMPAATQQKQEFLTLLNSPILSQTSTIITAFSLAHHFILYIYILLKSAESIIMKSKRRYIYYQFFPYAIFHRCIFKSYILRHDVHHQIICKRLCYSNILLLICRTSKKCSTKAYLRL